MTDQETDALDREALSLVFAAFTLAPARISRSALSTSSR